MAPELIWKAGEVMNAASAKVARGLTMAAIFVEGDAKRAVSVGNLTGDEPSKPGEPPRTVTGLLKANITHVGAIVVDGAVRAWVGVRKRVPYAARLEFGFVGVDKLGRNVNQAPRPFLRPAVLNNRAKIVELIAKG